MEKKRNQLARNGQATSDFKPNNKGEQGNNNKNSDLGNSNLLHNFSL